jgi:hypothetical protein
MSALVGSSLQCHSAMLSQSIYEQVLLRSRLYTRSSCLRSLVDSSHHPVHKCQLQGTQPQCHFVLPSPSMYDCSQCCKSSSCLRSLSGTRPHPAHTHQLRGTQPQRHCEIQSLSMYDCSQCCKSSSCLRSLVDTHPRQAHKRLPPDMLLQLRSVQPPPSMYDCSQCCKSSSCLRSLVDSSHHPVHKPRLQDMPPQCHFVLPSASTFAVPLPHRHWSRPRSSLHSQRLVLSLCRRHLCKCRFVLCHHHHCRQYRPPCSIQPSRPHVYTYLGFCMSSWQNM